MHFGAYKARVDFLVVVGMVLIFIPIILYFHVRFLTSTILFFAVPTIFLFTRHPKQLKRVAAVTLAGMIFAFSIDFLAEFNAAWSWAPQGQLVFTNKILGLIPADVMIWYFLWVLMTVVYYEHFFEHERSEKISPLFNRALLVGLGILFLIIFFTTGPSFLNFSMPT